MKNYLLILLIFLGCTKNNNSSSVKKMIEIVPLSPYSYTFETDGRTNRIDYYTVHNPPSKVKALYHQLEKEISARYTQVEDYKFLSIYIYKETSELNEKFIGSKKSFDGRNNDLVAFIRFVNNKKDIFYILKNSKVIYDGVEDQKLNFEFDE